MDDVAALEVGREAIMVLIKVSAPIMLVALVVGLLISLFQALTQIQEMTLSFVPKILAIFISLLIFMPFVLSELTAFNDHIMELVASVE